MEIVGYLRRNDFTKVCVEGRGVITARDGKKAVYIIVSPESLTDVVVSQHMLSRARSADARIDIIHVGDTELKHFVNAVTP